MAFYTPPRSSIVRLGIWHSLSRPSKGRWEVKDVYGMHDHEYPPLPPSCDTASPFPITILTLRHIYPPTYPPALLYWVDLALTSLLPAPPLPPHSLSPLSCGRYPRPPPPPPPRLPPPRLPAMLTPGGKRPYAQRWAVRGWSRPSLYDAGRRNRNRNRSRRNAKGE